MQNKVSTARDENTGQKLYIWEQKQTIIIKDFTKNCYTPPFICWKSRRASSSLCSRQMSYQSNLMRIFTQEGKETNKEENKTTKFPFSFLNEEGRFHS